MRLEHLLSGVTFPKDVIVHDILFRFVCLICLMSVSFRHVEVLLVRAPVCSIIYGRNPTGQAVIICGGEYICSLRGISSAG